MAILNFVLSAGIGAIIGLFTNGLAIKMLFRPFNPIYLDRKNERFRVPFTPGLIPKERNRIAKAIGKVVGTQLLDDKTIINAMLSQSVHDRLTEKVTEFANKYTTMDCTIQEFATKKGYVQKLDEKEALLSKKVCEHTVNKIKEIGVGDMIIDIAMQEISKKTNSFIMDIVTKTIDVKSIGAKIETMIENKIPNILDNYINKEYVHLKDKKVGEVATLLTNHYPDYPEKAWKLYKKLVEEKAPEVIANFDVASIVEQKINEFDLAYLEKLINDIAKKELDALVWLGGLLGAIMGLFNAFI